MKISTIEVTDFLPIRNFKIENLGSTVIIAGANGSGKTRLKQAIVGTLQGEAVANMLITATRKEEEDPKYFNGKTLRLQKGHGNQNLNNYISSRKYARNGFVGSLVQIDSHRNVESLSFKAVNWLGGDPDDKETSTNFYFSPFRNRWTDFMNYIHQKSAARDKKLADELKKNPKNGEKIIADYPDPLQKYKEVFAKLLPGKILQDINPASPQEFRYTHNTHADLPFSSLSSGEQEVVKVVFDVIRNDIRHSVIIVDEPELHLHPTLTFKLVETLKQIGDHTNQFIFLTHSADLISTYYSSGDVYFIDTSPSGGNQAHKLSELDHTHSTITQLIGNNLGLFAVGKKLIFIEGERSSIDRLTYHSIAKECLPDAKIIPVGSVTNILTLNSLEGQIRQSIFGIDIFMIRDRDGLSASQINEIEKNGRIKCLKKRHIENYFLDPEILLATAELLYLIDDGAPLTATKIDEETKKIAEETLKFNLLMNFKEYAALNHFFQIPSVKSLDSKDLTAVKTEIVSAVQQSVQKLSGDLTPSAVTNWLSSEEARLQQLLSGNEWRSEFQGKIIFSQLCSRVFKIDALRFRQAYVDVAISKKPAVFDDIFQILRSFQ